MIGKHILLIVGGGIAAFKALELVRALRKAGAQVTPVLTAAGAKFVTPLSLSALAGSPLYSELFDLKDEAEMGHIQLSRASDLVVVCPATANLLARMANGLADDLATTLLLATDKPVLAVPAMNVRMWQHAATAANIATLRARGVTVMQPDDGEMACGEFGPGRLPEVAAIAERIATLLQPKAQPLSGRHVLVTAGPTHEPIDPVRYIANRSSGKQGFEIAAALAALGARVSLVAGPVALATPNGVDRINVQTAREMRVAVEAALPADAAVFVAAVADWFVAAKPSKLKKTADGVPPALELRQNPDILAEIAAGALRPQLIIGFAAETEAAVANAISKRLRKNIDWIIANDVSGDVMGGDRNTVHLVSAAGVEDWPELAKAEVAQRLAARIAEFLEQDRG
jgi:phosphopantothenoylcysteine decarboxylase/phosphopantothenate--cysteine ligase